MLSRERQMSLPGGTFVDLPLLVPSFSSKGFGFFTDGKGTGRAMYSEVTNALEQMGGRLTESFLLSAYDLHHRHLRDPRRFVSETSVVLLDSGGYELSPDFDSTEPRRVDTSRLSFSLDHYRRVLDDLTASHEDDPLIIASFDWGARGRPVGKQVAEAKELFDGYQHWGSSFLLKPTGKAKTLNVDGIVEHLPACRRFSVMGVTEKELGSSLFDRLRAIARLRQAMNDAKVLAPLHVWGGLDPLVTPLYYFAGADVFDGVSWLRYSYQRGLAVNRDCYPILNGSIRMRAVDVAAFAISDNQTVLAELQSAMRAFGDSNRELFDVFGEQAGVFRDAYKTMTAHIPELRGR